MPPSQSVNSLALIQCPRSLKRIEDVAIGLGKPACLAAAKKAVEGLTLFQHRKVWCTLIPHRGMIKPCIFPGGNGGG